MRGQKHYTRAADTHMQRERPHSEPDQGVGGPAEDRAERDGPAAKRTRHWRADYTTITSPGGSRVFKCAVGNCDAVRTAYSSIHWHLGSVHGIYRAAGGSAGGADEVGRVDGADGAVDAPGGDDGELEVRRRRRRRRRRCSSAVSALHIAARAPTPTRRFLFLPITA